MKETIKLLAETNERNYNILKAIEEIGDVKFRVKILEQLYDKDKIKARFEYKVGKCQQYINEGKYIGGV